MISRAEQLRSGRNYEGQVAMTTIAMRSNKGGGFIVIVSLRNRYSHGALRDGWLWYLPLITLLIKRTSTLTNSGLYTF